jgi:hypothetical protein
VGRFLHGRDRRHATFLQAQHAGRQGWPQQAANRNAGVTGLPCLTRRSVLVSASLINVWV